MVVAAPDEAYKKVLKYGEYKAKLRIDQLILQALMAGFLVGMACQTATTFAGKFHYSNPGETNFLYACLFPVGFMVIIYTGAELFTGNVMTMVMGVMAKRVRWTFLLKNWVISLFGNMTGATLEAFLLNWLTSQFSQDSPETQALFAYLEAMCVKKVTYPWGTALLKGIGCNIFVCLSVWCATATDDGAGKVLLMWFPVVAFAVSGFEHCVANFWTLNLGLMQGVNITFIDVLWRNWIPVILGNLLGGSLFVGIVYWYNFHPIGDQLDDYTTQELLLHVSKRLSLIVDDDTARTSQLMGNRGKSSERGSLSMTIEKGKTVGETIETASNEKAFKSSNLFSPS